MKKVKIEVNPKTGCKPGSKADQAGMIILAGQGMVVILGKLEKLVTESYKADKHKFDAAKVRRHAMGWIDYLRLNRKKLFKEVPAAVEFSRALRASLNPESKPAKAKTDKPAKKAAAKKPVKKATKKAAPKSVAKPVAPETEASESNATPPADGANL